MSLPAFDTHAYVKRLQQAGFNEKQAEAQAELQSEVLSALITEKLATKSDIIRIESELKHLTWMVGFLLTGVVTTLSGVIATLFKLFFHS